MPLLDVSELTLDPDFATTFDVVRSGKSVSGTGRTVLSPVTTPDVVGVVTPATTNDLARLPDLERQGGAIVVFTRFDLTAGGDGTTADIVTWSGRDYTVDQIDDYSQFGAGYVKATCRVRSLI